MIENVYENTKELVLFNDKLELVKTIVIDDNNNSVQEKFNNGENTILYSKFENVHEIATSKNVRLLFYIFPDKIKLKRFWTDGTGFSEDLKDSFESFDSAVESIIDLVLSADYKVTKTVNLMTNIYAKYFNIDPSNLEMWSACVKARHDIL